MTDSLGPSNDKIPAYEWRLAHKHARVADDIILRNQAFDAQTPEERRVTIAKDVLKWLGEGKLEAKSGTYFSLSVRGPWGDIPEVNGFSCKACAVGGAAACIIDRLGGVGHAKLKALGVEDVRDVGTKWRSILGDYFSGPQLALMETAFERDTAHAANRVDYSEAKKAWAFGFRIGQDDRARMVAIYENIIANNGTFIP